MVGSGEGGRNILINSRLKRILFMTSDKQKRNKNEKKEKPWKKKKKQR